MNSGVPFEWPMAHSHFSVEMARKSISEQPGLTIFVTRLPTRYATSMQKEPLEACASRKFKLWNRTTAVPVHPLETKREKPLETGKHQFLGSSYLSNPNCEVLLHLTTVVTAKSYQSVPCTIDWYFWLPAQWPTSTATSDNTYNIGTFKEMM